MSEYGSWGNYPNVIHRAVHRPTTRSALLKVLSGPRPLLPYGNGRSQGDSCLNESGTLIDMRGLNHFLSFDAAAGVVRCEAGVTLAEILQLVVPRGWFLSVTPGTKYVTVGGALANDVHGKNHHRVGSFGHHVRAFELIRSDGERIVCRPESPLWAATIGGLGLTGVITWVELQLRPVTSEFIDQELVSVRGLDDLFQLATVYDQQHEYSVAWVDCLAQGARLGRGWLLVGNHAGIGESVPVSALVSWQPRWTMPFYLPSSVTGRVAIRLFNELWYRRGQRGGRRRVHFNPFFYPLDGVEWWNRVYGRRGFFQYQCVVPRRQATAVLHELLERIAHSQLASFLSTVKFFGDQPPAGMLSFPRAGVALAVDFANRGTVTLRLFDELDDVVRQAGGALYPAKDSRMSPEMFVFSFPRWQEFQKHIDPAFSSSFWRRVNQ